MTSRKKPVSVGAPTKYDAAKHPIEIVKLMREEGYFVCELCSHWDICKETFRNWCGAHPEFLAAYKRAAMGKQAWWFRKMRDHLVLEKGESFNTVGWSMAMRYDGINTDERTVHIDLLGDEKDYVKQSEIVRKAVSSGEITTKEAQSLQNIIATAAKVEEVTEMKRKLEELEAMLNVR